MFYIGWLMISFNQIASGEESESPIAFLHISLVQS
jgi:hypothetical protein